MWLLPENWVAERGEVLSRSLSKSHMWICVILTYQVSSDFVVVFCERRKDRFTLRELSSVFSVHLISQGGDREAEVKGALHETPSGGEDRAGQSRPRQAGHHQETKRGGCQEEGWTQERWENTTCSIHYTVYTCGTNVDCCQIAFNLPLTTLLYSVTVIHQCTNWRKLNQPQNDSISRAICMFYYCYITNISITLDYIPV